MFSHNFELFQICDANISCLLFFLNRKNGVCTSLQFGKFSMANRLVTPVGAHEVIQAQCLDDDTEQAQLLGVLGGVVSAVRSATGAGLCDTIFLYPVTVVVRAKCSDSLGLCLRRS